MAKAGLKTWFAQKWVDIGSKKKDGSFAKCGRSKLEKDRKSKYPKCVPLAKARRDLRRRPLSGWRRCLVYGGGGVAGHAFYFVRLRIH